MSKTMKMVVAVGVVMAMLIGSCLLCLVAGALTEDASTTGTPGGATRSTGLDGRYACKTLSVIVALDTAQVQWQNAALPPFTLDADGYETADGNGAVSASEGVVTFSGGPYDGWRGLAGSDTTGSFILFDGKEHHRVRTDGAKRGDFKCYRQRD